MDIGLAFTYPTKDPDWAKKILVVGLINLVPFVGQIYMIGWMLEIIRRVVVQRQPISLPDVDFSNYFMKGLKAWVVSLAFALPIIILSIPMGIISASMDSGDPQAIAALFSLCIGMAIFAYALLMALMMPAAYAILAVKDRVADALRPGEIFNLVKAAPGAYLITILGTLVTALLAQVGLIACVIGVVFTATYATTVNAYFYGQAYLEATGRDHPTVQAEVIA